MIPNRPYRLAAESRALPWITLAVVCVLAAGCSDSGPSSPKPGPEALELRRREAFTTIQTLVRLPDHNRVDDASTADQSFEMTATSRVEAETPVWITVVGRGEFGAVEDEAIRVRGDLALDAAWAVNRWENVHASVVVREHQEWVVREKPAAMTITLVPFAPDSRWVQVSRVTVLLTAPGNPGVVASREWIDEGGESTWILEPGAYRVDRSLQMVVTSSGAGEEEFTGAIGFRVVGEVEHD